MHCSESGYAVIRAFEGRSLKAYRDEVGVVTIGYGNTNSDASVIGFTIKLGMTITAQQADSLLKVAMGRRYEPSVRARLTGANQPSFDAGCSFHYNTGAISRASWVKAFVAHRMAVVHSGIMQWNKAGGRVLAGLTRRRAREWAMISAGDYGPEGRQHTVTDEHGRPVKPEVASGATLHTPGMLRNGDVGAEVSDVHALMKGAGLAHTDADDVFGASTESAIGAFQGAHPQLKQDGTVGPATRAALRRDADARGKLARTATNGGAVATAQGAVHAALGLPVWAWVGLGAVIISALAYVAWSYRDEIRGWLSR